MTITGRHKPKVRTFCVIKRPLKSAMDRRRWAYLYNKDVVWEIKRVYNHGHGPVSASICEVDVDTDRWPKVPWKWIHPLSPLELLAREAE